LDAVYLVHSSLRRVGGLVDGLRYACGSRSTIVVPIFTARNSTTYGLGRTNCHLRHPGTGQITTSFAAVAKHYGVSVAI
jgi:hypothetical protein